MHADILEDRCSTLQPPPASAAAARRGHGRRLFDVCRRTLVVALGALLLLWVGLINGRPSVFSDTALYYSQAEYLADALGLVSPRDNRVPAGDPTALPAHPGEPNVSIAIDGGRSPIYGLFVYALERLGGLWLVAAAQAAMVALALYLLFRAAAPGRSDIWYLLWLTTIAALTSAPAFSSFIMPDIFGGVTGLTGLTILLYWDRQNAPARAATAALLVFSLSVHRANLLALLGMTAAAIAWLSLTGCSWRRVAPRAGIAVGAAAASGLLVALSFVPINHRAGETVRDPPFLMARLLADGPGRRYLQYACDHGGGLALCRFRHLPPEDSDTLLWSHHVGRGLFGVSDFATQMKLEAQEHGFVLAALAYAPVDELAAAGRNTLQQLAMTHVQSPFADPARFLDDGYWRRTALVRIIPGASTCRRWGSCAPKLSQPIWGRIHDATLVVSLVILVGCIAVLGLQLKRGAIDGANGRDKRLLGLILVAAAFVVSNAIVCGALSAPVARYQARLIWLIPALALLIGGLLAEQTATCRDPRKIP
ncbi:MAG: hypothetical protein ACYDD1_03485 [Caulobacteraceae bacterium]